ncbi:MAG: leucine-rich repeat domain-containing protein [Coriobacteriales bacterium]|nr:leucine-rich repeat domain-containing protein [Coriobacteriales bacterium]
MKQHVFHRVGPGLVLAFIAAVIVLCAVFAVPLGMAGEASGDFTYEINDEGTITLTAYTGSDSNPVIPQEIDGVSVTHIGESCFSGLLCINKVHIPEGIVSVGDYAFECCNLLQKVYFPDSLISIGDGAFSGCNHLVLADMQDGIESIGRGAFLYCSALVNLDLPANLKTLGDFAFAMCSGLMKVTFNGESLDTLPDRLFYECSNLTKISFPKSITQIGKRTFSGCGSLTYLYFAKPLTSIGEYAFEHCSSLTRVEYTADTIGKGAFFGTQIESPDTSDADDDSANNDAGNAPAQEASAQQESTQEDAVPEAPKTIGSYAGDKSLFDEDMFKDYVVISNDDFASWCEKYLACNSDPVPLSREITPYILLYKAEVIPRYLAMVAVQNHDPAQWAEAVNLCGDDFEQMYLMINHGLFTELSRGKMCDNLILYSGVYDSQLEAAAGTDTVPTLDQLAASVGRTFVDPVMISTTTSIEIACGFSDTLFIIYASRESMEALGAVCIDAYLHTRENEILMSANATYKILDVGTMEIQTEDYQGNPQTLVRDYLKVELLLP